MGICLTCIIKTILKNICECEVICIDDNILIALVFPLKKILGKSFYNFPNLNLGDLRRIPLHRTVRHPVVAVVNARRPKGDSLTKIIICDARLL